MRKNNANSIKPGLRVGGGDIELKAKDMNEGH